MAVKCQVSGLEKAYGSLKVVQDVSFDVEDGEFVVLLGPSGCGKTTTLRMIAGLEKPSGGSIAVGAQTLSDAGSGIFLRPEQRDIGMVFQSYAIWPHMSVFENVAYPLRARGTPKAAIGPQVERVLDIVGLTAMAGRSAVALSGGQMQRVALARALVYNPSLILFDEPLSNLDLKLRERLRIELKDLQRRTGLTSIYVTHDQAEAVELGDKVIVMDGGRIVQMGAPHDLYRAPASRFVAQFISAANIFEGSVVNRAGPDSVRIRTAAGREIVAPDEGRFRSGDRVDVVIHPEDCALSAAQNEDSIPVTVRSRQFQGTATRYTVDWTGESFDVTALGTRDLLETGSQVALLIPQENIRVLPKEGAR